AVAGGTTGFKRGGARMEAAAAELEHGLAGRAGGPAEIDGATGIALVNDPGGRRAAGGSKEGRTHVVGAGKQADHGARLRSRGSARKGFGSRRRSAGVAVIA